MQQMLADAYHWRMFHEFMHFLSGIVGSFIGTWAYFKVAHRKGDTN